MLYNFAADSFYIMKLCSGLFVLHCRSRPKYDRSRHFVPHFEEVGGGVEPWLMARWKARAEFFLSVIELLFLSVRRDTTQVLLILFLLFYLMNEFKHDAHHRSFICHALSHSTASQRLPVRRSRTPHQVTSSNTT